MSEYVCSLCNSKYPVTEFRYKCDCGGVLDLKKLVSFPLKRIAKRKPTIWRYWEAIPLENKENIVSFDEGMTPLIDFFYKDLNFKVKLDYIFPTGSYKDRGASVLISKLKEIGVKRVIEDSSGNAGAAAAGYSAKAQIKCEIYCPQSTSEGKLLQIQSYGAKIKKIPGTRTDTSNAVLKDAEKFYYASHNWNPFFLEGTKTAAFEISEQLDWKSPDNIICPIGFGSIYLGLYIGFKELLENKIVERLPKLLGVQSSACCPIYKAFINKEDIIQKFAQKRQTIAEGICAEKPIRDTLVMKAMKETHGAVTAVSDAEITRGIKILAQQGLFVEPTSAVVIPAVDKFYEQNIIKPEQTTILILTGSGLKTTEKFVKMFYK
ncbi:MAG: threonine synthase [Candidatus Helarchaeota archaeon]|nr:threonine synthase [Candidatus Helarchaeota archaeon]